MKMKKIIGLVAAIMIVMAFAGGCRNTADNSQQSMKVEAKDNKADENKLQPVTIETFNHTLTFDAAPKKVVSLNYDATQILVALGLQDKIVGVGTAEGEVADCLPEYQEELGKLKIIAEGKPSFEVLLQNEPDFVFGTAYAFGNHGIAPAEDFLEHNIKFYVTKGTYKPNTTVLDVYEDILNIGKIFRVEERAEKLVSELKAKEDKFKGNMPKGDQIRVFAYDSGDKEAFTSGKGIESDIIRIAGGKNIFDDVDNQFTTASWEEVAKTNPQVIVIHDYNAGETDGTLEEKIKFLKSHPGLQDVDAIKNDKFVAVKLIEVFPGLQVFDAIEKIQAGLK